MGEALIEAAAEAGIRITLLDTCYLASGFGTPPEGVAAALLRRRRGRPGRSAPSALRDAPHARIGAAIHSVRAVPADQLATVAGWARERGAPLHAHLSEQRAENEACLAAHGRTPGGAARRARRARRAAAAWSTRPTSPTRDIARLGGTAVCMCATTERDLADGIGPARALADAGAPLCLGSDSHAVIDPFEEARAVELDERLRTERRGHFTAAELLRAATNHAAIGWPEAGRIEPGALADLVTVSLDSVRLAGAAAGHAARVGGVRGARGRRARGRSSGGRRVVAEGRHADARRRRRAPATKRA